MRTYPIMLRLGGRPVVVVGAGSVGLRKADALRRAGAQVRLVAPRLDPEADTGGLEVVREPYRPALLDGAVLVFAATDDAELNRRIADDARRIGAWVNVADTPEECDFYLSSVLHEGEVVVAVGTGGAAPALSAWLRRHLADRLPERLGEYAAALERIRSELKASLPDTARRMDVMRRLVTDETHRDFLARGPAALRAKLAELLHG